MKAPSLLPKIAIFRWSDYLLVLYTQLKRKRCYRNRKAKMQYSWDFTCNRLIDYVIDCPMNLRFTCRCCAVGLPKSKIRLALMVLSHTFDRELDFQDNKAISSDRGSERNRYQKDPNFRLYSNAMSRRETNIYGPIQLTNHTGNVRITAMNFCYVLQKGNQPGKISRHQHSRCLSTTLLVHSCQGNESFLFSAIRERVGQHGNLLFAHTKNKRELASYSL